MARKIPTSSSPSGPTRPGPLTWATLVGVIAVAVVTAGNYQQMKKIETRIDARFADLDSRLGQVQAQAAQAAQRAQQQQQQRRGPDPNKVYTLSDAGAPAEGSPGAPITIFEVSDFQWPFCARVGPTLDRIKKVYGDAVRIVWKHHPLEFHKDAPLAHLAAEAAHEQGKFDEFKNKVFANQAKIKRDDLVKYAREIGLDMKRFQEAIDQKRGQARIDADLAETQNLGVTGTPGFFVNGRFLSGAKPFEEFAKVINTELTKLGRPVPAEAQGM